ncbi:MAG: DUF1015 domain-containing protein [Actinomycetota bacterium]|nr:DUF1015 domain-containing protein [Actinomycetota bacterium]
MPRIFPFRGLLYDPSVAGPWEQLTAPPYDVISESDQEGLRARSPYNIVHVDQTEGTDDDGSSGSYAKAASLLAGWRASGVLTAPEAPCYYGYELRYALDGTRRRLRGIVGALELEPWGGTVLPHEHTMAGPIEDRLRLLRATRTHLSPIYGTISGPCQRLNELLDRTADADPIANVRDEEGVEHRMWAIYREEDVTSWLADEPLLIADGHHRYATALAYRDERRAADGPGPWDRILTLVVDAGTEEVPVLPYHRVQVGGDPPTGGQPAADLAQVLAGTDDLHLRYGTVTKVGDAVTYRIHQLRGDPPTVLALHEQLLDRVAPGDALRFTHIAAGADAAVRHGSAIAAYLLPGTTPDRVRAVIQRGGRLPRKSTFFWPKPRTGMILMPVDGSIDGPADQPADQSVDR